MALQSKVPVVAAPIPSSAVHQVFWVLRAGFTVLPVVFESDKFADVLTAVASRFGSWVVAAWLVGIIGNLLLLGDFYDVALRDVGLLLGALSLAQLAAVVHLTDRVPAS
ncbi:hypothetical protein SAMN05661080_01652 [Modestobacter sp. DSM 44400]|uniref:hypothetical protein n=1 Tax=Modestobacter sp. DSM 44400 TaxID=1550230 RepID=UPI000898EB74|nr:hypothetical protein [Modestobacter sp. DSM 44400]SDX90590.1 hypothetical protein SAMN05661080_01652 [Modestobacter sp. DSM 44400]